MYTLYIYQRGAVRMSHESKVWREVVSTWNRTLNTLFDEYQNPADAKNDWLECAKPPISKDFIDMLVNSFEKNVELFKTNASEIPTVIEKLVLINELETARKVLNRTILVHINSADNIIEPLIHGLMRASSTIKIDNRNEFCKEVIPNLTYELVKKKCNKKLAPLFFDFILIILDLCVLEAPKCALRLLEKSEFYPWKDLAPKFKDLVRSCAAYDKLQMTSYFSELDSLENIVDLAVDRAKVHTVIFRSTHEEALKAIYRWSTAPADDNTKKTWSTHVYRMGKVLIGLIDSKQVTLDVCTRLIKALQQSISDYDEDIENGEVSQLMGTFFTVEEKGFEENYLRQFFIF